MLGTWQIRSTEKKGVGTAGNKEARHRNEEKKVESSSNYSHSNN